MTSFAFIQYDEYGRAYELGVPMGDRQLGGSVPLDYYRPLLPGHDEHGYFIREGELMRNFKGQGFIVVSTDGSLIDGEVATYDEALDKANEFLDAGRAAVVIYEAVALIRPRRDVVARLTKRGGELETQRKQRALASGSQAVPLDRDYEGEALDEVNEIAPTDEPKAE